MPERAERGKMANDKYSGSYNAGPQLPSYMKKNTTAAKRTAAQDRAFSEALTELVQRRQSQGGSIKKTT